MFLLLFSAGFLAETRMDVLKNSCVSRCLVSRAWNAPSVSGSARKDSSTLELAPNGISTLLQSTCSLIPLVQAFGLRSNGFFLGQSHNTWVFHQSKFPCGLVATRGPRAFGQSAPQNSLSLSSGQIRTDLYILISRTINCTERLNYMPLMVVLSSALSLYLSFHQQLLTTTYHPADHGQTPRLAPME